MKDKELTSMRGRNSDHVCATCGQLTNLSADTARDILMIVAQRIFERRLRHKLENFSARMRDDKTKSRITISTEVLISILQGLVNAKRDMDLATLAMRHTINQEYVALCNQTAAVISRTYIELGDGAIFADDEALSMIRDMLIDLDGGIIKRNRVAHIKKRRMSGYGLVPISNELRHQLLRR